MLPVASSSEKIKLVYNWIGPSGPIWNTELPNILNFAIVSNNIKEIGSNKVFCDDARLFFSSEKHNYEVYPVCSLEDADKRPFVLPFGLSWRIPFERYFSGTEGIIEFSHVPDHVINLVRDQKGFILINNSMEAFMWPEQLDALHGYFANIHRLPLYKIIYLTGCINAQDLYNEYCLLRNIPSDKMSRLSVVTYPTHFPSFVSHTREPAPNYDTEIVPEKLFLMWNRRPRTHRVDIVMYLEQNNLIDRSLVSFSDMDADQPNKSLKDTIYNNWGFHLQNTYGISSDVVNNFVSRLPLIIDGEKNVLQMTQDYNNASRPFYQKSLVSIITETNFYDTAITLTEKSFKAAKEMHPFIIAGVSGVIKGMHQLGFQTFNQFWDESYDDIKEHTERMRKIMELLSTIAAWNEEQIIDFRRKVKPILEHNYRVIQTAGTKESVAKITSIIRNE